MKNFCSIYDIIANIPQLYSKESGEFTESIGLVLDTIERKSSELKGVLFPYITTMEVTPYLTYPMAVGRPSNYNSFLKKPTLLLTNLIKESDTYKLVFSSDTQFLLTTFYNESLGNGDTTSDFTSSDGAIKIYTTDWVGTFAANDTLVFSYNNYEDIIRNLAALATACHLLKGRYVSEGANTMNGLNIDYCGDAKRLLNSILAGDMDLECQSVEDKQFKTKGDWQGYNIDELGISQTPPTT